MIHLSCNSLGRRKSWSQTAALTTIAQTAEGRTNDRNFLALHALASSQLSPTERQLLRQDLWSILNHSEGRVLLVDLGEAAVAEWSWVD